MKLSINRHIINRPMHPEKHERNRLTGILMSAHSRDWENIDCSFDEAIELIAVHGFAVSAELSSGHRDGSNFVSRQLFAIDIDQGMTVPELLSDPLYQYMGAGYYTSPSHTEQAPRFRILFVTEKAITDASNARHLFIGLMSVFHCADPNCKDAARLFFGSLNAAFEKRDAVLSDEIVQTLIEQGRDLVHNPTPNIVEFSPLDDIEKENILKQLCSIPVIPYDDWLRIGWGLKQGGFSLGDFQRVTLATTGVSGRRTALDAQKRWNQGSGKVTLGTVRHFIDNNNNKQFDTTKRVRELFKTSTHKLF